MKICIGESATLLATIIITGSICYSVLSTLAEAASAEPRVVIPWTPPKIEQCDLELWERIRGNCP